MSAGCPQDVRRTSNGQKREDPAAGRLAQISGRVLEDLQRQPARVLPGSFSRCGAREPGIRAAPGSGSGRFRLCCSRPSSLWARNSCRRSKRTFRILLLRGPTEGPERRQRSQARIRARRPREGPQDGHRRLKLPRLDKSAGHLQNRPKRGEKPPGRSPGRVSLRVKANGCSTISRRPALSTSSAGRPRDVQRQQADGPAI